MTLPPEFRVFNRSPVIRAYAPDGKTVAANGVWTSDSKALTFTLAVYANEHAKITGNAWARARWDGQNEIVEWRQDFELAVGGCSSATSSRQEACRARPGSTGPDPKP